MVETGTILSQSYGYGYIVGLGAAFAIVMVFISYILAKYMNQVQNSERFTTASRTVNTGLISSAVVSSWIWPASLLTSSIWGYNYGISGGYLYAMNGGLHVLAFTQLAIEIKRIAPGCHTVAEIVKLRYSKATHFVYLFYVGATNVMVASCLLLGASQGFHAATGIHIVAANYLLPIFTAVYTMFGGLKSTFLSDWIHTVIIYIILLVMFFKLIATSDIIGSPGKFYDMLIESEAKFPKTTGTNFLNFRDKTMFMTAWSVCIGGFSSVFGDPSYAQKAIAAAPKSVLSGYVLGTVCWMSVPWALGIVGGLCCRALLVYPGFRTYPDKLSATEVSSGLPLVYAMGTILGKSGAAAGILMLFMSVTSALSAELIAFSSICTYDIYRTYIKPDATGKQLVASSHLVTILFSLFVGSISVVFNYIGVTVSWLITFYGIILSPCCVTIICTLYMKSCSDIGMIYGPIISTLGGVACWIASAYSYGGSVNKTTLLTAYATIVGNFVTMGLSVILIPLLSQIKPQNFDFSKLAASFTAGDDADQEEKDAMVTSNEDKKELRTASFISLGLNIFLLVVGYLIIPLSFYGTNYTFSKRYFTSWVILCLISVFASALYILIFPLYQGKDAFCRLYYNIKHGVKDQPLVVSEVEDSNSNSDEVEEVEGINLESETKLDAEK